MRHLHRFYLRPVGLLSTPCLAQTVDFEPLYREHKPYIQVRLEIWPHGRTAYGRSRSG